MYDEEGKWQEAIENTNRAHELEANIGPLSNLQLVQHHGILARLYEKAGDIDSMRIYIRPLLTNVNSSYKDDPEAEIECLFRLCKPQTAKRLDSSISDIYLLLRATLVACQYESSSSTILLPGTWMPRFVKLTHGTPLNWLFGAPDPRPQTRANLVPLHSLQQGPEYPILIFDDAPRSTESKPGFEEGGWSRAGAEDVYHSELDRPHVRPFPRASESCTTEGGFLGGSFPETRVGGSDGHS